jgi:hypothetical protein
MLICLLLLFGNVQLEPLRIVSFFVSLHNVCFIGGVLVTGLFTIFV